MSIGEVAASGWRVSRTDVGDRGTCVPVPCRGEYLACPWPPLCEPERAPALQVGRRPVRTRGAAGAPSRTTVASSGNCGSATVGVAGRRRAAARV